jgi:3'(2'), 5'-bisphosphate nucleotidase
MSSSDADIGRILADIVEEAGRLILPYWSHGGTVAHTSKADMSPVTEADQVGETLILARLAEHFPDVPVVAEEQAAEFGTPDAVGARFFLVDPVDGTKAFMKGDPNFTVNIGLVVDGRPVAGAVCAPASGETWFTTADGTLKRAAAGEPETPVRVRPWPKGEAVCLISHTMKPETADALQVEYGFDRRLALDSSIKLCRIAEGAADIYPRHGPTSEWDIAAAQAVLQSAGGSVRGYKDAPFIYGKADKRFLNEWFVARGG